MSLPNDTATQIARALVADKAEFAKTNPGAPYTLGPAAVCIRRTLAAEIEAGTFSPMPDSPRAAKAAKSPLSRHKGAVDDSAWLDELEKEPAMRFIDVRRELGRCQFWGKGARQTISRKRFVNWLLKADPTVGYDAAGKSSTDAKKTNLPAAPKGWLATLRKLFPDSVYFQTEGQFEIVAESDHAWAQIPATARQAIEKEMRR